MSPLRSPNYCRNRSTGHAYTTVNYRQISLGRWKSPESLQRFRAVLAEFHANGGRLPSEPDSRAISVAELIDRFGRHADDYYRKPDGRPTTEVGNFRSALAPLDELFGAAPAGTFSPSKAKAVREVMIERGWNRNVINRHMGRVRQLFIWAVEQELVDAATADALRSIKCLAPGRTPAPESEPQTPAPDHLLKAALPRVSRQIAAMMHLQLFTAMRPGEVVQMRMADIENEVEGELWEYVPPEHKNAFRNQQRRIPLGPRARLVLEPFADRAPASFFFSPIEAEAERHEHLRQVSGEQRHRVEVSGSNNQGATRQPGDRYTVASYRRCIERACDKAFPPPSHLSIEGRRQWQSAHRFSPNQLRHTRATEIRRAWGPEGAQLVLGHRSTRLVDRYAQRDANTLHRIAREDG